MPESLAGDPEPPETEPPHAGGDPSAAARRDSGGDSGSHSESAASQPWRQLRDVAAAGVSRIWSDADGEVAQFLTAEQRGHRLIERLAAAEHISVECEGGQTFEGRVLTAYRDGALIDTGRLSVLVLVSSVVGLRDLSMKVNPPSAILGEDLSVTSALSHWLSGSVTVWRRDGSAFAGELIAVWSDCVDVFSRSVTWTLPLSAVAAVGTDGFR